MTGPADAKKRLVIRPSCREQVLAVLREADGPMKRLDIAACLGKNSEDIGSALSLLVAEGLIVRVSMGRYYVPAPQPAPDGANGIETNRMALERVAHIHAASRLASEIDALLRPAGDRRLLDLIFLFQCALSERLSAPPEGDAG